MKKNIAIITGCLTSGGAERAAGQLSKFLSQKYDVYLFVMEDHEITYEYGGKIVNFYLNKKHEKYKKSTNPLKRLFAKSAYISTIRNLKKAKKKYNIYCTISFLDLWNIMNICSKQNDKIIVSVRNNRSKQNDSLLSKIENWFIKHYYNKTHKVISLSYGVEEDLINNFNIKTDKVKTIYNFFDTDEIISKSKQSIPINFFKIYNNNKILITMGRLQEQKNMLNLVEYMSHYLYDKDDIKLIILGRGPLKETIEKKIVELKMENKIFLFGYCNNPYSLIKSADVFLINSLYEGLCNSIVEAMICKTFVISTDCKYGPRELISNKKEYKSTIDKYTVCDNGILVPLNNMKELNNAVDYVLNNDRIKKKIENNAFNYTQHISNENIILEWISAIEEDV